jgi:hypothetical protein
VRFDGEIIRILYHQLPTDKQLALCKAEEALAKEGIHMLVDNVSINETSGEIHFCAFFNREKSSPLGDVRSLNQDPDLSK